jgi:hypothetical protein
MDYKEQKLKEWGEIMEELGCEFSFDIRMINRTQFRLLKEDKTIDIYPLGERFSRIPQNVWGDITDLRQFLTDNFK